MYIYILYIYIYSVYRCICLDRVYMYIRKCLQVYACIKFICICKLFTSVSAFITNISCISVNFILVCTCISYIYIEHPIVYMYVWVIYRCLCTCFMCLLISEVWFKSYVVPHTSLHSIYAVRNAYFHDVSHNAQSHQYFRAIPMIWFPVKAIWAATVINNKQTAEKKRKNTHCSCIENV